MTTGEASLLDRRFEVLGSLGHGSSGRVVRARDRTTREVIAIKELARLDDAASYAFKREFRLLSHLVHPHLVQLHELHHDNHEAFFSMELVEGMVVTDAVTGRSLAERSRLCLALAEALRVVHAAGHVHGDLKPANIVVDATGRLVLLDLGLAQPMLRPSWSREVRASGTPAYMAPELLWGGARASRDPAATDLYALGVVLFEILSGASPFDEGSVAGLRRRLSGPPPRLGERGIDVSKRLEATLAALLDPRADARPPLATLIDDLAAVVPGDRPAAPRSFVGRTDELAEVERWTALVHDDVPFIGFVSGESGIGKSTLLSECLRRVESQGFTVFVGRCHPGETLPFRAMDAIVEELAQMLAASSSSLTSVAGPERAALASLFPVLRRHLGEIVDPLPSDPTERRRRGFLGLRRLFATIAAERPVMLWIDDLQWADGDSLDLLKYLMHPALARVGLLVSHRPETAARTRVSAFLSRGVRGRVRAELGLDPLGDDALGPHSLDARIAAALERLDSKARALLELLAAIAVPLLRRHVLAAEGIDSALQLRELLVSGLVSHAEVSGELAMTLAHDKVRTAVMAPLDAAARIALHQRAAASLQRADAPPGVLIEQLMAAGDHTEAIRYARAAADEARRQLAFRREAELHELLLELAPDDSAERLEALALALERSGEGVRAAETWLDAAEAHRRSSAGSELHVTTLEHRAGEQFVRAGEVARGRQHLLAVLTTLGVGVPRSDRAAMLAALWRRLKLFLRGLRFTPRTTVDVEARGLARLDALWSAATSLAMLDHVLADAFCVAHTLGALALGEPRRALKSLGYEAVFLGRFGASFLRRRSLAVAERVAAMARQTEHPYDRAWALMSVGTVHWLADRWSPAADSLEEALATWERDCSGVYFERSSTCAFLASAYYYLGRIPDLMRVLDRVSNDVEALGNRFALDIGLFDPLSIGALLDDDPVAAMAWVDEAWAAIPETEFRVARFTEGHTRARVFLYRDQPADAWAAIESGWPHVRAANVHWVESFHLDLLYRRAQTAAVLAARQEGGIESARGRDLLRRVDADRRTIEKSKLPVARPWAITLRAAASMLRGSVDAAADEFAAAAVAFDSAAMPLFRIAALHECARARDDRASAAALSKELALAGVTAPARFMRTLVPVVAPSSEV